jgi:hypothetical protein
MMGLTVTPMSALFSEKQKFSETFFLQNSIYLIFGSKNSVGLFKIVCVQVKVFIFWVVQEHTSIFYKFVCFILFLEPFFKSNFLTLFVDSTNYSENC